MTISRDRCKFMPRCASGPSKNSVEQNLSATLEQVSFDQEGAGPALATNGCLDEDLFVCGAANVNPVPRLVDDLTESVWVMSGSEAGARALKKRNAIAASLVLSTAVLGRTPMKSPMQGI
ncbi:hypothetical protein NW767_005637 [Fusarium falciforme]|nr:hypothetical protein NW767_005637 [Fusarium falciforme]